MTGKDAAPAGEAPGVSLFEVAETLAADLDGIVLDLEARLADYRQGPNPLRLIRESHAIGRSLNAATDRALVVTTRRMERALRQQLGMPDA